MTQVGKLRKTMAMVAAAVLGATSLTAAPQQDRSLDDWTALSTLVPHSRVTIHRFKGKGGKVRGRLLSSDDDGITIRTKAGQELTIAKADTKRVLVRRRKMGLAPLIGAGAGGGVAWSHAEGAIGNSSYVIASMATLAGPRCDRRSDCRTAEPKPCRLSRVQAQACTADE